MWQTIKAEITVTLCDINPPAVCLQSVEQASRLTEGDSDFPESELRSLQNRCSSSFSHFCRGGETGIGLNTRQLRSSIQLGAISLWYSGLLLNRCLEQFTASQTQLSPHTSESKILQQNWLSTHMLHMFQTNTKVALLDGQWLIETWGEFLASDGPGTVTWQLSLTITNKLQRVNKHRFISEIQKYGYMIEDAKWPQDVM